MKTNPTLEILISTMNRKDLSFLEKMFPVLDLEQYQLLIINQTKLDEDLVSDVEGIRVINSREFGLSKSRNLAIENATGDILVIADDDIEYLPNFKKTILEAYEKYNQASLISFQYLDKHSALSKIYPKKEGYIKHTKQYLSSVEMTFKASHIQEHKLRFNVDFGLGAKFVCAEEQLLRHEVISRGLKVVFVGTPILIHKGKTSASDMGRPNLIRATTAYKYLVYKNWAYIWLFKYVFFLYRHDCIPFVDMLKAYRYGQEGILEIIRTNR